MLIINRKSLWTLSFLQLIFSHIVRIIIWRLNNYLWNSLIVVCADWIRLIHFSQTAGALIFHSWCFQGSLHSRLTAVPSGTSIQPFTLSSLFLLLFCALKYWEILPFILNMLQRELVPTIICDLVIKDLTYF